MSHNELLEDVIDKTGGCGIYQWITVVSVHAVKLLPVWNYHFMTFAGQTPAMICTSENRAGKSNANVSRKTTENMCLYKNSTECTSFVFEEDMTTLVSELDLTCDRKWIGTFIFSLLLIGCSIGAVISGQVADKIGRKPVYCSSVLLLILFNVLSATSTSWVMYAALQFVIGVLIEANLNVGMSLCVENTPKSWRALAVMVPSWPLVASLFALAAWCLHDWRKLHLLSAVIGIPFLVSWCLVQESVRWMTTKQHTIAAERAITFIATINRTKKPDLSKLFTASKDNSSDVSSSSILDLFREKSLRNITVGIWIIWFGNYFAYFGIAFGVNSISGNLYTNMFLLNIVDVPVAFISPWLVNRFGRKKTAVLVFFLSGICASVVGVLKYTEVGVNEEVIRVIALVAKLFTALCCSVMLVYTLELYPTVVRTTAFGFHLFAADGATVIVPFALSIDETIRGSLYFFSGALLMLSAVLIVLILRETKGLVLEERISVPESNGMMDKTYHSIE